MNNILKNSHNPDVLSCLSNLSSDEIFTPPELANKMLNLLPQDIFRNPDVTFLDPACKTGIFLSEIAKRLIIGLEPIYPKLEERLDHIFKKQLYGIAITELTALLSRRTLYCSKYANSKYSIVPFNTVEGNIRFKRIEHNWINGKCSYCGASKAEYSRNQELETYAYEFIHCENPERLFNMKFDVIVGNPPYDLKDGGGNGASATPIYQFFVQTAKKMNPRFISMITPSRWFTGGKGLDKYRDEMLHDLRLQSIHDYIEASDCFSGVQIKGGGFLFSLA